MSKYVDRVDMPIMGTGSLMLYKRPELDADIWHYRAKIEGKKGYIRRSTKETNLRNLAPKRMLDMCTTSIWVLEEEKPRKDEE